MAGFIKIKDGRIEHIINLDNVVYMTKNDDETINIMFQNNYAIMGVEADFDEVFMAIANSVSKGETAVEVEI